MSEPNNTPSLLGEALAAILKPIVKEAVREAMSQIGLRILSEGLWNGL